MARAVEPVAAVEEGQPHVLRAADGSVTFAVKVTNRGPFAGSQRVLAFVRPRLVSAGAPASPPFEPAANVSNARPTREPRKRGCAPFWRVAALRRGPA
eukprot:2723625-Prymnesium_polylepis.1